MRRRIVGTVALIAVALGGPGRGVASDNPPGCSSVSQLTTALDYRQRNASDFNKWRLNDNNTYHLTPALERMRQGEFSRAVRADLEFLLGAWPNHYPGLEAMIRYDLAGGPPYGGLPTECFLLRARNFAPGDITVLLAEAYYFWKKGRTDRALKSYEDALEVDSESADANYFIGLLYFELGQYALSERHAKIAYQHGYQLPGLRNKLIGAGHWSNEAAMGPE